MTLGTFSGLFDMIARGDRKTAGVDLTGVVVGVGFATIAWKPSARVPAPVVRKSRLASA